MSIVVPEPVMEAPVAEMPTRKKWTRAEVKLMDEVGLFEGGPRYELIEGDLIRMAKNRPHATANEETAEVLRDIFGRRYVNTQQSIDVAPAENSTNQPEPDVIVMNRRTRDFGLSLPQPADIVMVVEISDTTLRLDSTVKAGIYARAGIKEYWIVDIQGRRLLVMRDPCGGEYRFQMAYGEGELVSPLAQPDSRVVVASLLP